MGTEQTKSQEFQEEEIVLEEQVIIIDKPPGQTKSLLESLNKADDYITEVCSMDPYFKTEEMLFYYETFQYLRNALIIIEKKDKKKDSLEKDFEELINSMISGDRHDFLSKLVKFNNYVCS